MGRWITIHTPHKLAEAQLIRAMLEAEGVRTVVQNESLYAMNSELGSHLHYSPHVQVLEAERERALAILYERGVIDSPKPDSGSSAERSE